MSTPHTIFYNALHSPVGAFASLTLGCKGASGGLGLELKGPANESIYIGVEDGERPGRFNALPFFDGADKESGTQAFDVEGIRDFQFTRAVFPFKDSAISRRMGPAIDEWKAGDLTFRIATPVRAVPDPDTGLESDLKEALAPSIVAELTIDNSRGTSARKAFFGYAGSQRSSNMRVWRDGGLVGIGQGRSIAIGTDDETVYGGIGFQPEAILIPKYRENLSFMLGNVALLVGEVPPGETKTFRFAIGFFRDGAVTTGLESRYLYRRWFERVEDVVHHALCEAADTIETAQGLDFRLQKELAPERALMLAQAMRGYFGSSQCLELTDGRTLWVINEGEYRMMNTFDLAVDQIYFELALNPWTVRNVLDFYVHRYAYEDRVKFPGSTETYPGGIAFTHDMGVANVFSEPGYSCYEQAGLRGVFSYMSCEQLVNWSLCACLYLSHTQDRKWMRENRNVFRAALQSLMNRDHPDPNRRNGIMGLDSARCGNGSEITTYDSLDASLGQARNNLYLAVKTWAAYALMQRIFEELGDAASAADSAKQAATGAETIVASADQEGFLPAVLGEGIEARIIPAIEGLIYPYIAGRGDLLAGELFNVLETHFDCVLRQGICLFPDGGWRLSSTSRNSWLSKIYLCQAVAEQILGKKPDTRADRAHLGWLMDEDNVYFAWSDQMHAGKAHGSRYYPRGVTGVLWLAGSGNRPLLQIRETLMGTNPNPSEKEKPFRPNEGVSPSAPETNI